MTAAAALLLLLLLYDDDDILVTNHIRDHNHHHHHHHPPCCTFFAVGFMVRPPVVVAAPRIRRLPTFKSIFQLLESNAEDENEEDAYIMSLSSKNELEITSSSSRRRISTEELVEGQRALLGINLGNDYSLALNETDRLSIQQECRELIDQRVAQGILDLQQLHGRWGRQMKQDVIPLEQAMAVNAMKESKRFATALDSMVGTFWNQTAASRKRTHDLFALDEIEQKRKAREEAERKVKKEKRRGGIDGGHKNGGAGSFPVQSWKKTNSAWDDWDDDNW